MYIEKRKVGKSTKYYLVYSYREKTEVKKLRRYLGTNISAEELQKKRATAEIQIKEKLKQLNTEIFNFSLSKKQIEKLNRYDSKIKVWHLEDWSWKNFIEQFVYNTNAIEGSTVQEKEVSEILHKGNPKDSEEKETKGVARAVSFIRKTNEEVSLGLIKKLHKLCFKDSKPFSGEIRKVDVTVENIHGEILHWGAPFAQLPSLLNEMIDWYKRNKNRFKPLVLAAIMHNQLEHIHPFQDGNGRVGRLLLNFILIKNKYPPINISLENRAEYYQTLQEYSKSQNLKPTMLFLIKQYKKTLRQVSTKKKKDKK
jgi:Fic family protein